MRAKGFVSLVHGKDPIDELTEEEALVPVVQVLACAAAGKKL